MATKTFDEVQIGDIAYDNDCYEPIGKVLAKGSFFDLQKEYDCTSSAEEILEEGYVEPSDLNLCVAVSQNPKDSLEGYKSLIFLYDFDPSSAICIK